MWTRRISLLCVALFASAADTSPGVATKPADPVAVLEPFVGEWTIDATWAGGAPLKARSVCAWTLGKRHLSEQTFVGEPGQEHQRYQTYLSYDAKLGTLVSHSFAVDARTSAHRVETDDGKTFKFGHAPLHADSPPAVRQTITFADADTYTWRVEVNDGGDWKQVMNGTWARVKRAHVTAG